MKIGLLRVSLHIPDSGSLKNKRSHLQGLKQKIRNKFNVSIAEIGSQDLWQRIDLAAAMVSTDASHIDRVFGEIMRLIAMQGGLEILDESREMF